MRIVVKVGGSLLEWPPLGRRLRDWLANQTGNQVLVVPGGGAGADAVRALDRAFSLGEERAHWLALRVVAFNARMLVDLIPNAEVAETFNEAEGCWQRGQVPILDGFAFARADEANPGRLPHCWAATSDSLAARAAQAFAAQRLVLLKSTALPAGIDWEEAARRGLVDEFFPQAAAALEVDFVDFTS